MTWLKQQLAVADSASPITDRAVLGYWLRLAIRGGEPNNTAVLEGALNRMCRRDIPVTAADADSILGLQDGATVWFNHGGHVPAQAVLDEIERCHPNRPRDPENGRLLESGPNG